MNETTFTAAQLAQIRQIVREELAPAGETIEATAPEPAYHPITIHFRDGTTAGYELDEAAHAKLVERWQTYRPGGASSLASPARRRRGMSVDRCMLCCNLADILYID